MGWSFSFSENRSYKNNWFFCWKFQFSLVSWTDRNDFGYDLWWIFFGRWWESSELFFSIFIYFSVKLFTIFIVVIVAIAEVNALFTHVNKEVHLGENAEKRISNVRKLVKKKSSAIMALKGPPGSRIDIVCNINFYTPYSDKCYRNFFYIGNVDDGTLRNFEYFCGYQMNIRRSSLKTDGVPVLVIGSIWSKKCIPKSNQTQLVRFYFTASTANENASYGDFECLATTRPEDR